MVSSKQKWFFRGLIAFLFVLMLLMNMLTPWIADDYHYAFSFATDERLTSVGEIFPSLAAHTRIMNGRSTPHFLVQLFTLLPKWTFDVCNSAVFILMILGMHRLACGRRTYDIAMLCGLAAAVFVLVPGFGPSFLWMAGSCNYLWCDVLLMWLLVPYADAVLVRDHTPSLAAQLVMIPAALFFGNMSQNVSAAGIMLMGLSIMWLLFKRQPVRWWMFAAALAAFAGWMICMSAPADVGRIRFGTPSLGQIMDNFQLAANMMVEHGAVPGAALLMLIGFAWHNGMEKQRIAIAIACFAAAMASNYAMAVSVYYPTRAFTGTALLLICGCGVILSGLQMPKLTAPLALCLIFIAATSLLHALPDMYKCFAMYNDREAQVAQAVADGETAFTTFGIQSRSRLDGFFELYDLTNSPNATPNKYYARYHGLESIVIDRLE